MIFQNHSVKSLSLRNIVAARFPGVRRQRSLRPMKLDTEKVISDGRLLLGVERNRLVTKERKGKPVAYVDQDCSTQTSSSPESVNLRARRW
jgi:hypothetical protein